jgi:hypothetical protein
LVVPVPNEIYSLEFGTRVIVRPPNVVYIAIHGVQNTSVSIKPGNYIGTTRDASQWSIDPLNTIFAPSHTYESGEGPFKLSTTLTLPDGLNDTTLYYVEAVDSDFLRLHTTSESARNGGPLVASFTKQGFGVHTIGSIPFGGGNVTDGYGVISFDLSSNSAAEYPAALAQPFPMPEKLTLTSTGSCTYWFF